MPSRIEWRRARSVGGSLENWARIEATRATSLAAENLRHFDASREPIFEVVARSVCQKHHTFGAVLGGACGGRLGADPARGGRGCEGALRPATTGALTAARRPIRTPVVCPRRSSTFSLFANPENRLFRFVGAVLRRFRQASNGGFRALVRLAATAVSTLASKIFRHGNAQILKMFFSCRRASSTRPQGKEQAPERVLAAPRAARRPRGPALPLNIAVFEKPLPASGCLERVAPE